MQTQTNSQSPPRMTTHFVDGKPRWRPTCDMCGKVFVAKSPRTEWCSPTCRTVGLAQRTRERRRRNRNPHAGRTAYPARM